MRTGALAILERTSPETGGGERPSVSLVGPKGSRAQHSVVTQDFNDGSYGVTLTPDKPGSYKFTVSPLN